MSCDFHLQIQQITITTFKNLNNIFEYSYINLCSEEIDTTTHIIMINYKKDKNYNYDQKRHIINNIRTNYTSVQTKAKNTIIIIQ